MPVGWRSGVPAKITSSMREPRRVLADCSPRTQEMASAIFDLPQPLGPMMAAIPSPWNLSSVRSQKDLNPKICSFFSFSNVYSLSRRHRSAGVPPHAHRALPLEDGYYDPFTNRIPPSFKPRKCLPRLDREGTDWS